MSESRICGARSVVNIHGTVVEKTGASVRNELAWYKKCEQFGVRRSPRILGLVSDEDGDTLGMTRVDHRAFTDEEFPSFVADFVSVIEELRRVPLLIPPPPVETFVDWINREREKKRWDINLSRAVDAFLEHRDTFRAHASFAHGDMSESNILWNSDTGILLVDPAQVYSSYSSYLLDVASMYTDLWLNRGASFAKMLLREFAEHSAAIQSAACLYIVRHSRHEYESKELVE